MEERHAAQVDRDSGVGLVEVLVALMIFALLAAGFATSMMAVIRMTDDARDRTVAANLAAASVDDARSATDVMSIVSGLTHKVVDGTRFHIAVDARWVAATAGSVGQCSAGSGELRYKRVNVSVTWDGMRPNTTPVKADTQVAPSTRVSDPTKGVIVVSVRKASGEGNPGIKVKATAATPNPNGAVTVTATPVTDAQGCAYLLNVVPGNYQVSITKTGATPAYIDSNQVLAPTEPVSVSIGSSATAPFQFDQAGVFTPRYASNFTAGPVLLPQSMDTSLVNSYGIYVATTYGPFRMHPYTAGYSLMAGKLAADGSTSTGCQSIDPGAWPTTTDPSGTLIGSRVPVATAPGGGTSADIRMGVVEVTGPAGGYVKATGQVTGPATTADPGCLEPSSYVYRLPASGNANLAVPFGSWVFTSGTSSAQNTPVADAQIVPLALGVKNVVGSSSVVTIDPREIQVTP